MELLVIVLFHYITTLDGPPTLTKGVSPFEHRIGEPCNLEPELGDMTPLRLAPPDVSFGSLGVTETTTNI